MCRIEEFGDLSLQCADAYFEYGNVLLLKEEENPSNGLLGNGVDGGADDVEDDASEQDTEDVACGDHRSTEGAVAGGDEEGAPDDDLQIAWENLDVNSFL